MIPYIVLIVLVFGGIWLKENSLDVCVYNKSVIDLSIIVLFILFYSLRYNVGFDYPTYEMLITNGWYDGMVESKIEYLSYIIMEIAHDNNEPQIFFAITSIIALSLYFFSFCKYKYSEKSFLWIVLFFLALPVGFLYSLSICRQFVASAVLLFGTKYLLQKSLGKYILCILVASMFHMTSILFIILYLATFKKIKLKYICIISAVELFASEFIEILIGRVFPVYLTYFEAKDTSSGMLQILLYSILAVIFLTFRKQYDACYDLYLRLYLIGLMMCYSFVAIDPTSGVRLGLSGLIYGCFLCPYIIFNIMNPYYRIITCMGVVILASAMYFYGIIIGGESYVPYKIIMNFCG